MHVQTINVFVSEPKFDDAANIALDNMSISLTWRNWLITMQ